ncbi:MAG TPA: cupin domain-containing protein [Opitutaceae bacterium]|jgi:uncharacterized cupin superfamily protein|nr:cupin domain-containing protein [Opitutaceae bacterium]
MPRINVSEVIWTEQFSPKFKFGVIRKNLSIASGGKKDTGTYGNGHPFDVELVRVPPNTINWPLHAHAAQWEAYLILSGKGMLRTIEGLDPVQPGDYLVHPPGEAHQLINRGEMDLVYYVIADNPQADVIYYPDSDKYSIKPQRITFDTAVDYLMGEE